MGVVSNFTPAQLIVSLLASQLADTGEVVDALRARFGAIAAESAVLPFPYTRYYEAEMGEGLRRQFFAFDRLHDPAALSDVKQATNDLEARFGTASRRSANIDPGLLFLDRFVLATTKERAHRIPLRNGIYAELTLIYENRTFRALPWTYPDYASDEVIAFLLDARTRYRGVLRGR
jgi:Domain of unknown function (DUF4416)